MSAGHFSREFRETPYAYLMTRLVECAKALLRHGDMSLGSFSARFTHLAGETPTAYRARDHGALASVPSGCDVAKELTRPRRKPGRIGETRGALVLRR
jgi:AraC-like DNA-binding protein